MSIIDKRLEFCDDTSLVTTGTDTLLLGSQIDTEMTGLNLGVGDNPYLVIQIEDALGSTFTNTEVFHLVSDASAAINTAGTATYHFTSSSVTGTLGVAGYRVCAVKLPYGTYERYLGILCATSTAASTAGSINAYLTFNPPANVATPDGL